MIDPIQVLFIVVVTTLTILLVIIGVEVFRILQDAKKTIKRVNVILDDVETITTSVAGPIEKMSGFIQGVQQGSQFFNFVAGILESRTPQPEKESK